MVCSLEIPSRAFFNCLLEPRHRWILVTTFLPFQRAELLNAASFASPYSLFDDKHSGFITNSNRNIVLCMHINTHSKIHTFTYKHTRDIKCIHQMKTLIHKVILKILKTLMSPFPLLDLKFMIMQQSFVFKLSLLAI